MSYFIPRRNRYYALVAPFSKFLRYVLSCVIFSFSIMLWYLFLYQSLEQQKNELKTSINQKKELLAMSRQVNQMLEHATSQSEELHKEYATYIQSNSMSDIFFTVIQDTQEAGLTVQSCIKGDQQQYDWYQLTTASFQLEGESNKIAHYLEKLTKQSTLLCAHLDLSYHDNARCTINCQLQSIHI